MTVFWAAVGISWALMVVTVMVMLARATRRRRPADPVAEVVAIGQKCDPGDDAEAVARTALALEEVAELRRLARADAAEASFRTPDRLEADIFLMRLFKTRPQEWKP